MSFARLALAAAATTGWFVVWALGARRSTGGTGPVHYRVDLLEAAALTAFAALWFASLGHGAWWLLFGILGLLLEGPVRLRHRADLPAGPGAWRALLLGTLRLLGAGLVLSLLL